ncbi:MAG: glycosyltransferase [Geminicoccaceae bacterium]
MSIESQPSRIGIIVEDLKGGGVQRMLMLIASGLAERGHDVSLISLSGSGELVATMPPGVRLVVLEPANPLVARLSALRNPVFGKRDLLAYLALHANSRSLDWLPSLTAHIDRDRPDAIFAATQHLNMTASLAVTAARHRPRLLLSVRSHFSNGKSRRDRESRFCRSFYRRCYGLADAVTAVSHGVKANMLELLDLDPASITVVHSPTLTADFEQRAGEPVAHRWFEKREAPVIVAVGRPSFQKDFGTLVDAFLMARRKRRLRLMIVGATDNSRKRREVVEDLRRRVADAGAADDFDLPGWCANPLPYMKQADLVALSSRFEGLPNVLIEALACGTQVVATDCPSGPREILDDGKFGRLVPVGDARGLAEAILATLDAPVESEALRRRAGVYNREASIDVYEALLTGRCEADAAA